MRPRTRPETTPVSVSTRNVTIARSRKTTKETREPLKKRRKEKRKARLAILLLLIVLLITGAVALLWIPALRMHEVRASGPHAEEVRTLAKEELSGTRFLVIPRNSLFFIPESDIRKRILSTYPDIEAVSLSADGLHTLTLATSGRAEAFVWCGMSKDASVSPCYSTNAEGLIFAPASTTAPLTVYAPIENQSGDMPLGAKIVGAAYLPDAFRFVKTMQQLGASVRTLQIRGDEADLYTDGGTRITYVLGREERAAETAASIFPQLKMNDGSVVYVDLRFEGKGYVMRAGE